MDHSLRQNNVQPAQSEVIVTNEQPQEIKQEPVFFFANKEEEDAGIHTKTYPNGNQIKMVNLKIGKQAIVRQLKGRDAMEVNRRASAIKDVDYQTHSMAVATTIDGHGQPTEFFLDELSQQDYSLILSAYAALNFS